MKVIDNVKLFRPYKTERSDDIYHLIIEEDKIQELNKGSFNSTEGEIFDGKELTLAPSFNDSHMHLLRFGLMKMELDLRDVTSWEEMKQTVFDNYNHKQMKEHEWVVGRGMMDDQFDDIDHLLDARDLEELDYNRPVFFLHDDGHECVVNEEALKIIREKDELSQFPEEYIEKDEKGNLTGRFKDTVVHYIKFHFRQKKNDEVKRALREAIPKLLQNGITSVHTDDLNYVGSYETLWESYIELEREGELPIDVHLHHYIFGIKDLKRFIKEKGMQTGEGTDRVKVGSIKIFLDGTQRLHTAALRESYNDRPKTKGNLNYSPLELKEIVSLADNHNLQVAMHSIGDRAVEEALNAIEMVGAEKMRHRIIHAQILAPDLLNRLERVRPYLEIQPGFMMSEYDSTAKWVGKEREKYCNPWFAVFKRGIPFTCSSDCPIGPLSPMVEMFAAVNRTDMKGKPEGGWLPDEQIGIDTVYNAYTEMPALLEFQESKKGKLEEDFYADFVLLSNHPKEVQKMSIKDIKVIECWSKGERVYKND
ncbi:MAG: amidohydrolase family protein [Bacillota bacterium]